MDAKRIKEIQEQTAYPESASVQQALLKVWNECEQSKLSVPSDGEIKAAAKENCPMYLAVQLTFIEGAKWFKSHLEQQEQLLHHHFEEEKKQIILETDNKEAQDDELTI